MAGTASSSESKQFPLGNLSAPATVPRASCPWSFIRTIGFHLLLEPAAPGTIRLRREIRNPKGAGHSLLVTCYYSGAGGSSHNPIVNRQSSIVNRLSFPSG